MPRLARRATLVASLVSLASCSGGAAPGASPTEAPPSAMPSLPPASGAPASGAPASGAPASGLEVPPSFGVPECDHYAAIACACSNALLRETLCEGVGTSFATWSSAIRASPLNRDPIATACVGSERALVSACPDTTASVTVDTAGAATAVDLARDAPMPGTWDGRAPYECSTGNVLLTGITASLPGASAVYAAGSCHLTLIDMNVSGEIAVEAAGMAEVTIVRGTYVGTRAAVHAGGMSHVTASGATFTGGLEQVGEASVTGVP